MENYGAIKRVLWITMGLNLVSTVAKLGVGYWTGSLSLIADGFDSVFDAATNVIGLVGIQVAARPADEDHPYGHRKAETVTALVIAGLLFLTAWEVGQSAVERLLDPALITTEVTGWSFGALLVSVVVHVIVVWYELRAGRRLHSEVLVADALHTRADIFLSLSVVAGLIAVRLGYPVADPIIALFVALLIAKAGVDILRESVPTLMDRVGVASREVEQIALSVPGVVSCHGVRSRGHQDAVYADLHIQVDPGLSTERAHAIAEEVKVRLHEYDPVIRDVTIHVEPARSGPGRRGPREVVARIRHMADDMGMGVHEVWAYESGGQTNAEVHLELDGALSLRRAHEMASSLEERAGEIPGLAEVTTHIEPRGAITRPPAPGPEGARLADEIRRVANEALGSDGCHHVRVHRSGMGWDVSLHCQLPGDDTLAKAHRACTGLEGRLRSEVPGLERVVIHAEPED